MSTIRYILTYITLILDVCAFYQRMVAITRNVDALRLRSFKRPIEMIARGCRWTALIAVMTALTTSPPAAATDIHVLAAGSLKEAFTAIFADYGNTHNVTFVPVWGPSGVLRERIERGETFDVFASAALPHAQAVTAAGLSGPSSLFARNALCVVTDTQRSLDSGNLAATLLNPAIRIGTSTPIADPGGDYAWELFHKIDAQQPGAFATLSQKAQQLMGGPAKLPADGRHPLLAALQDHKIDVFIYYCSSAERLVAATPGLQMVGLPPELSVGPEYGLTVSRHAGQEAAAFAAYLLSPPGQAQLETFGFLPGATTP